MEPTQNQSPADAGAAAEQPVSSGQPQSLPSAPAFPPDASGASSTPSAGIDQPAAGQPTSNVLSVPMPAIADDTDLIEREWVDKAKAIVEHTRDDPHLQNEEINKIKADYIQKRYNRQIKIDEG